MNVVGKNEELLEYLSSKNFHILSSVLSRIDIFADSFKLTIDLHFKLEHDHALKIRFTDILEYGFYHNKSCYFYNVERCKFFKKGDTFYISLDPADEFEVIQENDQDFILCRDVEGYMALP